jgi:3-hydroxyisobutyrate dehydrogenase-like beta-hydroxyacid dehydrogenase
LSSALYRLDDGDMTTSEGPSVSFLGLGAMGSALAEASAARGFAVTAWNRSGGKEFAGGVLAETAGEAVRAADVVVVCLHDHASVHSVLDPVVETLAGRRLINLTTTTPAEARELADWAARLGADYLDGGVMAVPAMIGGAAAEVLYSGSADVYATDRALLESWGKATYFGADAGTAALYDLALLAGMYAMFAGFFHGAAMVGTAGISACDFAARATPWLQAMAGSVAEFGATVDARDFGGPGQQSLDFSDPRYIVAASRDAGVNTELVDALRRLVLTQIEAGHGADGFARVIESFRL